MGRFDRRCSQKREKIRSPPELRSFHWDDTAAPDEHRSKKGGSCPLWVISGHWGSPGDVRFTPESGHQIAFAPARSVIISGQSTSLRSQRQLVQQLLGHHPRRCRSIERWVAFARRSEWVPKMCESKPMPASHSETRRAYCLVAMLRRGSRRPVNKD